MRELPAPFLKMVQDDIERISNSLTDSSSKQWQLFRELDGRYQVCVKDWYKGMWQASRDGSSLFLGRLEERPQQVTDNLLLIKAKLESYQLEMNTVSLPELPTTQVNVTTNIGINITFEEVRSQVKEMSSLTDEQTQEVLEKLTRLKKLSSQRTAKRRSGKKSSQF